MLDFCGESHIIKVIKVEANESIGSPKRKDPLPELQSPKGGPFAPCGLPKPLPLGEVSPKVTERASPARKSRRRSDGQALCQSDTIAVPVILGQRPCPLSLVASSSPAPPKGEPLACRSAFVWTLKARRGAKGRALLQRLGSVFVQPLSLASLDSSPSRGASGEEEKFSAMPKPPLGRGGGIAKQ